MPLGAGRGNRGAAIVMLPMAVASVVFGDDTNLGKESVEVAVGSRATCRSRR